MNLGFHRKILLLLHLGKDTFLLHLLYFLAFLFFVFHHSNLRSVLLFATIFFNHFCHCIIGFGFSKVKKNMSYIGVLGNSPISADGGPKGNAPDRGTGGRILENCRRFFGFSGCHGSRRRAPLDWLRSALCPLRFRTA